MRASPAPSPATPRRGRRSTALAVCAVAAVSAAVPGAASAHRRHHHGDLAGYSQRNLVADQPGAAETTDPSLVNAWGISFGPATPAWIADNGTGVSTLYSGANATTPGVTKVPLTVSIPGGKPTGTVFNPGTAFAVHDGAASGSARFLFSSEAGVISGWNPNVPAPGSTEAQVGATVPGAIFKGLAIADTPKGTRLYATDFHNGRVDVWDDTFMPAGKPGAFTDHRLPRHFAPFGIQAIGNRIVVTYAKQDADAEDDVHGRGLGAVDVYSTEGKLLHRLARRGALNAPWGVAKAPARGFGKASGALLVGNFGDGRIHAFRRDGRRLGALRDAHHRKLAIDGLWALAFGNGVIGTPQTLLFTAGPGDEEHGLFGTITAAK
jgi:uncharacterized protein (TIGR03118 family)